MEEHPQHLFWLDLEMTGLDAASDRILEVAAIVTDFDLNVLASYQSGVCHPEEIVEPLLAANPWFREQSEDYQELIRQICSGGSEQDEVEDGLLGLVDGHIQDKQIILAGNSIHKDREFVAKYLPRLEARLHYRMLDVSAWKVYMQGKYGLVYNKQEQHRALADIHESIAEFKSYLKKLS